MKRVLVLLTVAFALFSANVFGALNWDYGWEDGTGTVLGIYGNAIVSNSTEQAYEGTRSLKFIENPLGGTPQAYVWWVTGLNDGDGIVAQFYVYDTTPSASPSGRIWGHYTDSATNVADYSGSAGGNNTYSDGNGWTNLQHSWIFDSKAGTNKGFVVEARIYSDTVDQFIYIDTASITVSNNSALIYNAAGDVLPEPMFGLILLPFLALLRRNRNVR